MEFQGTVVRIMPETKGTSARGEWQRQEVIFEMMDGQYARKIAVTFFNRPTEVQGLREGVSYNVSFNMESREFNNRWYTDIRAWRVLPADAAAAPTTQAAPAPTPATPSYSAPAPTAAPAPATADDVDDLPF